MSLTMRSRGHAAATIGKISPKISPATPPVHPTRYGIELASPVDGKFEEFIAQNRATPALACVQPHTHVGKSLALCGAGPSLTTSDIRGVDDIFACNSALPYLVAQGAHVTGGVGVDQTPGLLREWETPPNVTYYVASSCDPALIAYLLEHDRRVEFFHNAVGIANEMAVYRTTWPTALMVGRGFTVVSRAIDLAAVMGFERIDVYGADCAFGDNDVAHANGEHITAAYGNPLIMTGTLPPSTREWRTRPDMLRDAVELARMTQRSAGRVRLMGDTLPVALLGKEDTYLDAVSRTLAPGESPPDATALSGI